MAMLQQSPSAHGINLPLNNLVEVTTNNSSNPTTVNEGAPSATNFTSSSSEDDGLISSSPTTSISSAGDAPLASTKEKIQSTSTSNLLPLIADNFIGSITDERLSEQSNLLVNDFNESLSKNSKITMLSNYNISPSGNEHGQFLVIDLGGSTLRIAVIKIDEASENDKFSSDRSSRIHILQEESWIIDNNFKIIDYNFFKFIGSKISEIISKSDFNEKETINTGISWSFPLETTNYNNGKIVHVSKGYTISDEIYDKDLKTILETTLLKEFNLSIDIKAILNDSLAVYAAGSFLDKNMKLALVLGTGTNLCCSLNANRDLIHHQKLLPDCEKILFNVELSLFGQAFIKQFTNKYDSKIDSRFNQVIDLHFKTFMTDDPITNTILQPLELTTSGRYLPELTRLVLVDLINRGDIFNNLSSKDLNSIMTKPYDGVQGKLICAVDETNDYQEIKSLLEEYYGWDEDLIQVSDILTLKRVIELILIRGAFIVSISIVAIIKLLQQHNNDEYSSKVINIGYVGSVMKHFHNYRNLIKTFVNENKDIKQLGGVKVDFKLVEHSSIIGPAIGAAYYS
ncbi:hexokinase I [Scheffersomyces amazonensis]|uniref:hexokinase I n=1 Tax=Scheffersomyces amazonensis TaxID=1078765 RepID=UPI00315CE8C8